MGLGDDEEPVRRVSCFFTGVVGLTGSHALTRPRGPGRDQSRGPSLRRGFGPHHRRYYDPLGLPSGTIPLRHRLIGTVIALEGQPVRVSPVPCRAVSTCPPPYPGSVLRRSITSRRSLLPSPRHDRLGRFSLSVVYLTGLQGSRFRIGPAKLPPSRRPNGLLRALDAPLRREDFASRRGPATRGGGPLTATGLPPAGSTQQVGSHPGAFVRTHHAGPSYASSPPPGRGRGRSAALAGPFATSAHRPGRA